MLSPDRPRAYHNRAIIVDDDCRMARTIQRVLRGAGWETAIATDGLQVVNLAETFSPVLMTLDLAMPALSGRRVIDLVRRSEKLRHIKILVVSGGPSHELGDAVAAGADDALGKPFQNGELRAKALALLQNSRGPSAGSPQ